MHSSPGLLSPYADSNTICVWGVSPVGGGSGPVQTGPRFCKGGSLTKSREGPANNTERRQAVAPCSGPPLNCIPLLCCGLLVVFLLCAHYTLESRLKYIILRIKGENHALNALGRPIRHWDLISRVIHYMQQASVSHISISELSKLHDFVCVFVCVCV